MKKEMVETIVTYCDYCKEKIGGDIYVIKKEGKETHFCGDTQCSAKYKNQNTDEWKMDIKATQRN